MDYITKTLGVPVIRTEWKQQVALPLFLNDRYTFEQADIGGVACLIVHPVGELDTINTLKKHVARLHAASGRQVVFELTAISRQRRNSFIDAKLAVVVPEKQVYLPFLGALLTERCDSEGLMTGAEKLQPSAQMLLFALVGAAVDLHYAGQMGAGMLALLGLALLCRMLEQGQTNE